jgi:hypothetical protein
VPSLDVKKMLLHGNSRRIQVEHVLWHNFIQYEEDEGEKKLEEVGL